jgi:hypothetical protein
VNEGAMENWGLLKRKEELTGVWIKLRNEELRD